MWHKFKGRPAQLPNDFLCVASVSGRPVSSPSMLGDLGACLWEWPLWAPHAAPHCPPPSHSVSWHTGRQSPARVEWSDRAAGEGQRSLGSTQNRPGAPGVPERALLTSLQGEGQSGGEVATQHTWSAQIYFKLLYLHWSHRESGTDSPSITGEVTSTLETLHVWTKKGVPRVWGWLCPSGLPVIKSYFLWLQASPDSCTVSCCLSHFISPFWTISCSIFFLWGQLLFLAL